MLVIKTLKRYGAEEQELLDTYIQQIRSIAEMACPVWNAGLTHQEERGLERIQRTALAIIRGEKHTTYQEALDHFWIEKLSVRRALLCFKLAVNAYKNPKFSKWFVPNISEVNTRSSNQIKNKKISNFPLAVPDKHLSKNKNSAELPL